MNILNATTDPPLLTRLKEMLARSARADVAVAYFFMTGFEAVAEDLSKLLNVRILVGRTERLVRRKPLNLAAELVERRTPLANDLNVHKFS